MAAAWLIVAQALGVTQVQLTGPDLIAREVRVTSLQDQTLSYFDEQRNLQQAQLDRLVRLRVSGEQAAPSAITGPCIYLADGQRFPGEWIGATSDGASLRWRHDLIGVLTIALDDVQTITWQGDGGSAAKSAGRETDTIVLSNGDTMTGFVSALSDQGVMLIPDNAADPVTIPFDRITALTLANPSRDDTGAQHRVTLTDGTCVLAEDVSIANDQVGWLSVPPGGSPMQVRLPITDLRRIDFGTGGLRLVDISSLPIQTDPGRGVFGMPVPVRIEDGMIRAHAPTEIRIELPEGAVRFAASAELDTDDLPANSQNWADFHVVVISGDAEAGRGHVTADRPVTEINVPVSGPSLVIRLEPGVNGPILDRLLLKRAVVLLRKPPTGQTSALGR